MEIFREDDHKNDTTRLYEASVKGCVASLKELIQKNDLIVQRVSLTPFTETPLHVSALLGHHEFAKTLLINDPTLITELDSSGRSALHLASAKGHKETVRVLLDAYADACLLQDEDGRIPLHYAAMKGRVEVLKELIHAKPQSIKEVPNSTGETVLHLCVRHNRLECLKVLIEKVGVDSDFLNSRDQSDGGKTILHLALMLKQIQTIRYLLSLPVIRAEACAVNGMALATSHVLEHSPRDFKSLEIQQVLMDAGIRSRESHESGLPPPSISPNIQSKKKKKNLRRRGSPSPTTVHDHNKQLGQKAVKWWIKVTEFLKYEGDWLEKTRGMLMVVATMISTMTFQASISPPGGVWQLNDSNSTDIDGDKFCSEETLCIAGTAVLGYVWPDDFLKFINYNTVAFLASLSVTLLLISGFPLHNRVCMWLLSMAMCVTLTFLALTYLKIVLLVVPSDLFDPFIHIYIEFFWVWNLLLVMVGAIHTIRFLIWLVKRLRRVYLRYKKMPSINMSAEFGP